MFVEGIPIWEQLIYLGIILSVLLCGVIVILGFLFIHVFNPFLEFLDDMKKIWREETSSKDD